MLKLAPHLEPYDHIIWDWNGTLVDDVSHCVSSVNPLLQDHGLPTLTPATYKQKFGFPIRDYYSKLGFDFDKESFESLSHRFHHNYLSQFHLSSLVQGTRDLLLFLKQQGKILSVLSASEQRNLETQALHHDVKDLFHNLYGINNIFAASKLERGRELIRETESTLEKTVLIGDTDHDLEVGQKLGIHVILIAHGHQNVEHLQSKHDRVVDVFYEA